MKAFLITSITLLISHLSFAQDRSNNNIQTTSNCFELEVSCPGTIKVGFAKNNRQKPPATIKPIKKSERIKVFATFGYDIEYLYEYRADPNRTRFVQTTKDVSGIIAQKNNYGPQERIILKSLVDKGVVDEITYTLFKCE
jgi:hypothetical protein